MKVRTTYRRCEVTAVGPRGRKITCVLLDKDEWKSGFCTFEDVNNRGSRYVLYCGLKNGEFVRAHC